MKWTVFKIICFLSTFLFMQGAVMPWAISNDILPLWADMILITAILVIWLLVIEWLALKTLNLFKDNDDISREGKGVH